MTTPQAAAAYASDHADIWSHRDAAIHNPKGLPVEQLPVIYGFNNGGSPGWFSGVLLAADGTHLGGHICSAESYMPHDLGIVEGSRPDRHEAFREHYPDGYRMHFVSYADVPSCDGLQSALAANAASQKSEDAAE